VNIYHIAVVLAIDADKFLKIFIAAYQILFLKVLIFATNVLFLCGKKTLLFVRQPHGTKLVPTKALGR
jgi:hypothetical protein